MRRTSARTYHEWKGRSAPKDWLRSSARSAVIWTRSWFALTNRIEECIWFPYYHHVFDDERAGFDRHLRFFRQRGDFISLDRVVELLTQRGGIGGRYFCVTFDDGFQNCVTNALPILVQHKCPATFYLPTAAIDGGAPTTAASTPRRSLAAAARMPADHLDWQECRFLSEAGMVIGSHTHSHVCLAELDEAAATQELTLSKQRIEAEVGRPCVHFAAPWGRPSVDFDPQTHPALARRLGYHSFATTQRGPTFAGGNPGHLRRDHFLASWGDYQLRYFLAAA